MINLFSTADSREQYNRFTRLALADYEELKNQITNQFQSENDKEQLLTYKINIFAEKEYFEEYGNLQDNLTSEMIPIIFDLFYAVLSVIFAYMFPGIITKLALLAGFVFFRGLIADLRSYSMRKRKNSDIKLKRAFLFLNYFEIK